MVGVVADSNVAPAAGQISVTQSATEGDLSVRDLVRQYPGGAGVRGMSLSAGKGELIALLGASGCGKTTTLRCLAGIDSPSSGEISIAGQLVFSSARGINLPPERRNVGMVFQSYALWPHMTALENVAFPLRTRNVRSKEARGRAQEMLHLLGLGRLSDRDPGQLSGGQQQRVALARALVYQPKLLLFDEPLSNLDAELRESVRQDIRRIQRESAITAVYVTHDRTEAMALSDRILVMANGQLVQEGTPTELLARPASPFVASLLGSANLVHGTVERPSPGGDGGAVAIISGPANEQVRLIGRAQMALSAGSSAVICIRPTAIRLSAVGDAPSGAQTNLGTLRDGYPTGPQFEYLIQLGGPDATVVKAVTDRGLGLGRGDTVAFWYDPDDATCFPDLGTAE